MKHNYTWVLGEPQKSRLQIVKQNSEDMGLAQRRLDYDVGLIQRDGQRDCRIKSGLWSVGCTTAAGSNACTQYIITLAFL